jgi:hypothetical protein
MFEGLCAITQVQENLLSGLAELELLFEEGDLGDGD